MQRAPQRGVCPTGKVGYWTKRQADAAARRTAGANGMRSYWCFQCGRLHLTRRPLDAD